MGNKIARRRQAVEDRYTRPQGLYEHRDIDYKKLRRLILDSKLAPCYPGEEDCAIDLEECPICFLVCVFFEFHCFSLFFLGICLRFDDLVCVCVCVCVFFLGVLCCLVLSESQSIEVLR